MVVNSKFQKHIKVDDTLLNRIILKKIKSVLISPNWLSEATREIVYNTPRARTIVVEDVKNLIQKACPAKNPSNIDIAMLLNYSVANGLLIHVNDDRVAIKESRYIVL